MVEIDRREVNLLANMAPCSTRNTAYHIKYSVSFVALCFVFVCIIWLVWFIDRYFPSSWTSRKTNFLCPHITPPPPPPHPHPFPHHPHVRSQVVVPITKANGAALWCFLWSAPQKRPSKQSRCRFLRHSGNYDVTVIRSFENRWIYIKLETNQRFE